jgi:hypothetical protein
MVFEQLSLIVTKYEQKTGKRISARCVRNVHMEVGLINIHLQFVRFTFW